MKTSGGPRAATARPEPGIRPSRMPLLLILILPALGASGCGVLHEGQSIFCSDPCPPGYQRTMTCDCEKKDEEDDRGGGDDSRLFNGVFLITGDPCLPEGYEIKIFNNTSRTKRVRVQTSYWDASNQVTYTYDWYDVRPKGEEFVGCKVHLWRSYTIVKVLDLTAARPGPAEDGVVRIAALGSVAELLESPAAVFAASWTGVGNFVLTASRLPDCRRECLGEGYRCSQVPEHRLRDWKDGLAHFYSRSTEAAADGGSVSAATLASLFGAVEDPCERGDLIFRDGMVYNEGRDCTLTGEVSLGRDEVTFEIDLPGRVEGKVSAGEARAVFPDPARAPEIRFPSNETIEKRYGGRITSITLAEGSVLIGSADRCVALSASSEAIPPGAVQSFLTASSRERVWQ